MFVEFHASRLVKKRVGSIYIYKTTKRNITTDMGK